MVQIESNIYVSYWDKQVRLLAAIGNWPGDSSYLKSCLFTTRVEEINNILYTYSTFVEKHLCWKQHTNWKILRFIFFLISSQGEDEFSIQNLSKQISILSLNMSSVGKLTVYQGRQLVPLWAKSNGYIVLLVIKLKIASHNGTHSFRLELVGAN